MGTTQEHGVIPGNVIGEPQAGDANWIPWLVTQTEGFQAVTAKKYFDALLYSASQPRHISGNSCIKLCYFLEQCRNSESKVLNGFAFSRTTCRDLFSFYVEWNEKNQHRSMRQILELLGSLVTSNPDKDVAVDLKMEILQRLLSIMTHQASLPLLKPAFRALESFLAKSVVSVKELMIAYEHCCRAKDSAVYSSQPQTSSGIEIWDHFVMNVFEWMCLPDTSPVAGKVLIALFQKLRNASIREISTAAVLKDTILWQRWIVMGLRMYPETLENVKKYLFPPLFKIDRRGSIEFLEQLSERTEDKFVTQDTDASAMLLLSAMEVGKKLGIVDDPDVSSLKEGPRELREFVPLPTTNLSLLLIHSSNTIRFAAFSVLVSSLSSTKPFPVESLDVLQDTLDILHADTDAKFRNEVLSNSKHMIERLRGATSFLTKELNQHHSSRVENLKHFKKHPGSEITTPPSAKFLGGYNSTSRNSQRHISHILGKHKKFLEWYIKFLTLELIPTASYQRHITALNCLFVLLHSGLESSIWRENQTLGTNSTNTAWPFSLPIFTWSLARLLLDLVVNPYEDVRLTATELLKLAPRRYFSSNLQNIKESNCGLLGEFIKKTEAAAMKTGRADLADGAALAKELQFCLLTNEEEKLKVVGLLIENLNEQVTIAESDFMSAVKNNPVHVSLTALSKIWNEYEPKDLDGQGAELVHKMQHNMMKCCETIWKVVSYILCSDAPDGFASEELQVGTEELLNYAFRAVHESSVLVQVMLNNSKNMPHDVLRNAGQLSFDQLVALRHRGSISVVATTFAKCCQCISDIEVEQGDGKQLKCWYERAIELIHTQESTTRRSAGIPVIMTGILSSNSNVVPLRVVMEDLQKIARESAVTVKEGQASLAQVHALNCLREIFKSSLLRRSAGVYVADCFDLAASSLKSSLWAVRNAALLLFRSLIDALLGTSDADGGWDGRSSVKISYERYPTLGSLLLDLLKATDGLEISSATESSGLQAVFTVFELVRRAGPPADFKGKIFDSLFGHLGSAAWDVRELAARVLVALFSDTDWLIKVSQILKDHATTANNLHGSFVYIKLALDRCLQSNLENVPDILTLTSQLKLLGRSYTYSNSAPVVQAAFEDVLTTLLKIASSPRCSSELSQSLNILLAEDIFERACILLSEEQNSTDDDSDNTLGHLNSGSLAPMRKSLALRAVRCASASGDPHLLLKMIERAVKNDSDTALAVLKEISATWDISQVSEDTMSACADLYLVAYDGVTSVDVAVNIILGLTDILDGFMRMRAILPDSLREFCHSRCDPTKLNLCPDLEERFRGTQDGNMLLSNAMLRLRGAVALQHSLSYKNYNWGELMREPEAVRDWANTGARLESQSRAFKNWAKTAEGSIHLWSILLERHSKAERDTDERMAAVQSLQSFFCYVDEEFYRGPRREELLSPLLTLKDILVDDDEDIRQIAANVVSHILNLGQSIVPLAASNKLLAWLFFQFGDTKKFRMAMINKVKSRDYPHDIAKKLQSVNKEESALFSVESSNLFTDEVREACAWVSLLSNEACRGRIWDNTVAVLSDWSTACLKEIEPFWSKPDGPFGWTANPAVFSLLMRLLTTAGALQRRSAAGLMYSTQDLYADDMPKLRVELERLLAIGEQTNVHGTLMDVLRSSLQDYDVAI